jgi:hypothetical protein
VGHLQYLRDRKYSKSRWENFTPEQKEAATAEIQATRSKMLQAQAADPIDSGFKRLVYVRYADDFLIGVIGSKEEAKDIKGAVGIFLMKNLQLEMPGEKTLITHPKEKARFLSYDIFVCDD